MSDLDRKTLAQFLPNREAIAAFEKMFKVVGTTLPSTIEEANALAGHAAAIASQALSMLAALAGEFESLTTAPVQPTQPDLDDAQPRAHLGTISEQNHDAVEITGGTAGLDAGTAAQPSLYLGGDRTTGLYRSAADVIDVAIAGTKLLELATNLITITGGISVSEQITSTVATGTAPLVVASTTLVTNLHAAVADSLGTASSYPADATDLASCIALANALKAANTAKGV